MTKDEALDLALEALELHGKQYPHMVKGYCLDAITAIKQARALDKKAENTMIYRTFEQWKSGNVLEHGVPRTEHYSEDQLDLVEMGWNYGYDAGRAVEQALDKKAENARELGLDYEPPCKTGSQCTSKCQQCVVQEPDYKALWQQMCERCDELDKELSATDRQVEILSDALAESRREVAAIKQARSAPVQEQIAGFDVVLDESMPPNTMKFVQPAPVQEPVGCEGAIVNGRVYVDRLEHDYKFECEAGPLYLCNDWVEFRRCFEWLAEHAAPPNVAAPLAAQPAPVQEPVAWVREHELPLAPGDAFSWVETFVHKTPLYMHPAPAAPVQEPVHQWRQKHSPYWYDGYPDNDDGGGPYETRTLYTIPPAAQRQWTGLTDDEIDGLYQGAGKNDLKRAREIEAKLKEKNT